MAERFFLRNFAAIMANLILDKLSIGYNKSVIQPSLSLEAREGEMICLLGQNGCGKSTLIRTLAGFLPPLSGQVLVRQSDTPDKSLFDMTEHERSLLFSVVLTDRLSTDRTTVEDVVTMGRYPYANILGKLSNNDVRNIHEALTAVNMEHKRSCYFSELSDGEKQRTLIAKALAQQTPFILLDEPTAHLDLPNRIKTLLLLRQLARATARTILISTHELDLALQTADTIWLMLPFEGIQAGTPSELTQSGAFQQAFADPHFRFEPDADGQLRIRILD